MAIGHDKRDLLQIFPRDRTKFKKQNYNATLNPRNEICTLLPAGLSSTVVNLFVSKQVNCFYLPIIF